MLPGDYMTLNKIAFQVIDLPHDVYSAQDVASACNCPVSEVIKTVVFLYGDRSYVAVVPGDARVDSKRMGRDLNAHPLRMADADEIFALTSLEVGTLGPFGFDDDVVRVADRRILELEKLVIGSGRRDRVLTLTGAEFRSRWTGLIADISKQ